MKRTIDITSGGRHFTMDEDACSRLEIYLDHFRSKLDKESSKEVMEDLEERIADLLEAKLKTPGRSVNLNIVKEIVNQLGMPDGSSEPSTAEEFEETPTPIPAHKFFRDPDNKKIGGVCSGIGAYLNIDVLLVRVLMVVLLLGGTLGFWLYLILWLIAPVATTAADRCELRGIPVTAANMARYSQRKQNDGTQQ